MKRRLTFTALALVAALAVAGCGSNSDSSSASSGSTSSASASSANFNDADVTFVQSMIPHHEQAVQMAKTEQKDGKNSDAVALAKKIEADQTAEIAVMNKLIKS